MAYPRVSSSAHARSSPVFPRATRACDMVPKAQQTSRHDHDEEGTAETAEHAEIIFRCGLCALCGFFLPCLLDLAQRLAEDPDGGLRLPAREHERRREADRVLPRPEHEQPAHERGGDDRI